MDPSGVILSELRRLRWPLLLLLGGTFWLGTRHAQPGLTAWIHYLAVIGICAVFIFWGAEHAGRRRLQVLIGGAAVVLLIVLPWYAWTDTYTVKWTKRDATECTDTWQRWPQGVRSRRFVRQQDYGRCWWEGPVVDDKEHGHWRRVYTSPPHVDDVWFWQGSEVSEAEWKRRSG
ncbi:MAG: hypothetical protein K8T25_12280 [Planctomycetia bacterium]|nr:hypothetical protein [Planctomycetia bacterium]